MSKERLKNNCRDLLKVLCEEINERCVGSEGNRRATVFFEREIARSGWDTEAMEFDAMDWEEGGAILRAGDTIFNVKVSPYSPGFSGEAEMVSASSAAELARVDAKNKIILLHGDIAKEQLMPKGFVFYNPAEHQKIIAALEESGVKAIICATGRNAALAGGVYPFPLIEDGDFNIPSVYMTEEEGNRLLTHIGSRVFLESISQRIPGKGYNVIARKGKDDGARIVVTAHIDAKKGTPGAIDNATGVVILMLLADLLNDYNGKRLIEIVAFNGEDYYAVPGQMSYIAANNNNFEGVMLNINIDGAGYKVGPSAFSLFNLPEEIERETRVIINDTPKIEEGIQWVQGDHGIFLQYGIPAIAVSSKWFIDNIGDQDITHTPKDHPDIVDCSKIAEIAIALNRLIRSV